MDPERPLAPEPTPPPPGLQRTPSRLPATTFVWVIAAINVMVYVAMELSGGSTNTRTLIQFGAKVNSLIAQGEYWRLIAPIFIHIGPTHLLFNTIALLTFGRLAEVFYGHARFVAIYLVSGMTGVALSYFFSRSLSAGASGALFGIAGALLVFFVVNRRVPGISAQSQLGAMVMMLAINGVYGLVAPGIDNWGHAGGLIGGIALAAWLSPRIVPVVGPDGETVALRMQPSSPLAWISVPAVLAILSVGLRTIPPR